MLQERGKRFQAQFPNAGARRESSPPPEGFSEKESLRPIEHGILPTGEFMGKVHPPKETVLHEKKTLRQVRQEGILFVRRKRSEIKKKIRKGISNVQGKKLSLIEKITKPIPILAARSFINRVETHLARTIKPEIPEGFEDAILKADRDPDAIFVLVSNHDSLLNGAQTAISTRLVAQIINKQRTTENQFTKFMLTIAASLLTGHQNVFIQEMVRHSKKKTPKYSMCMEAYIREKDRIKYEMDEDNAEYNKKIMAIGSQDATRIADGLAFYLPGNMEEGRLIEEGANKGQRKGLQELNCEQFYKLMRIFQLRFHKNPVIIREVLFGSSDMLDPQRDNRPTWKAIATLLSPFPPKESFLKVRFDMPELFDDIINQISNQKKQEKITTKDINDYMGRSFAKLLPSELRGVYA